MHRMALYRRLQPLEPLRPWSLPVERALVNNVATTRIGQIHQQARFPDWLGFLRLTLLQTEEAERTDRLLTQAWGRQLVDLLPAPARADSPLADILHAPEMNLTGRDLESVERRLS
jgi:hypothetical protein